VKIIFQLSIFIFDMTLHSTMPLTWHPESDNLHKIPSQTE
jgi:hypothetical protein